MKKELMTAQEIHDFGIEIVFKQLQKEGHKILSVNIELGTNPQIVARKDGQIEFIIVRTACYPNRGEIESAELALQCVAYADKADAICYFASVGIVNADGKTETEMGTPVKGVGFHAMYEGLLILTRSDRVKVWGPHGSSRLTPDDVNGKGRRKH
ncbi:MAG TPA: hypothetical protein VLL03_06455 [Burkholderiales bacterium]|nr:hypothetical protein [Burkholderiales bacterium]